MSYETENESQDNLFMSAFVCSLKTMHDAEKIINSLNRTIKSKDQEIAELKNTVNQLEVDRGFDYETSMF